MGQTSEAALTAAPTVSAEPIPVVLDDAATRKVVRGQEKLEKAILMVCILGTVFLSARDIVTERPGIFGAVVLIFFAYLFLSIVYAVLKKVLFRPIRAVRYGRCARRIIGRAQSMIRPVMLEAWKYPAPGVIALDPLRYLLFVECRRTGFQSLLLRPEQIVDIKVEREQTVETVTRHSGQTIFMPFDSFGFLGGGRSRSTATIYERAFLEISFVRSDAVGVERVAVDFGSRRQMADDWVLSVNRMPGVGRCGTDPFSTHLAH